MKLSVHSESTLRSEPSIPAPAFRWASRVALPVGILLAFGGLFAGSMISSLRPVVAVETIPVVERPAIRGAAIAEATAQGAVIVQAAGWIEPDPFLVYATTLINGTVSEVLFLEGDTVKKGAPLARLIDDDARLALQHAEAEARAAEEAWTANIEAQRAVAVAAADVRETSASLARTRAELVVEQALLREAELIYGRRKMLVAARSIAQEEHDMAEAKAQAQAARVRVVGLQIEELAAQLDRVRADLVAAERRLELRTEERRRLDLSKVALAEARLRVERLEIRAPIDGVVLERMVEPGSVMMTMADNPAMSQAATLYDPARLQVRVDVPLAEVGQIGVGQEAEVVVEVLPDVTFTGQVTRVIHRADIQKNTLEVKVALDAPSPALRPDMLARVRFRAAAQTADAQAPVTGLSVFAPSEAIAGDMAWIVTGHNGEEGLAARRAIATTGAEADGWKEIASGLSPGDLLIAHPPAGLQPDQRVRILKGDQ